MDQRLSERGSTPAAAASAVSSLIKSLFSLLVLDARAYRPEKYYMRGPGPKWREKHSHQGARPGSGLR